MRKAGPAAVLVAACRTHRGAVETVIVAYGDADRALFAAALAAGTDPVTALVHCSISSFAIPGLTQAMSPDPFNWRLLPTGRFDMSFMGAVARDLGGAVGVGVSVVLPGPIDRAQARRRALVLSCLRLSCLRGWG